MRLSLAIRRGVAWRFLAAAVTALAPAACSSRDTTTDPGPARRGEFTAVVQGSLTRSLTGNARHDAAPYGRTTVIKLTTTDHYISFQARDPGRPAVGRYDVATSGLPADPTPPLLASLTVYGGNPALDSWVARSGTVTITRSEPGALEGEFDFRAERWFPTDQQPRPITVRGRFSSICTPSAPCP